MRNLKRALNYQLKRDNGIIYILLAGGVFLAFLLRELLIKYSFRELTGSQYVISMGGSLQMILGMLVILLAARIVGWDYNDKTINYEILSGYSRRQVFLSRVLVSMAWCMVTAVIVIFLPLLIFGLINGWGNTADMWEVLLRYGLALFPIFRLVCEIILLTVLVKNCYMAMVLGYTLFELLWVFVVMAQLTIDFEVTTQLSSIHMQLLFVLDKFSFGYIDGEDVVVYDAVLEPGFMLETVVVSLVVGAVCLLIGYWYFKKSDMD